MPRKKPARTAVIPTSTAADPDAGRNDLRDFGPGVPRARPSSADSNASSLFMARVSLTCSPTNLAVDEDKIFQPSDPMNPEIHVMVGTIVNPHTKGLHSLVLELTEEMQRVPLPRNNAQKPAYHRKMSTLKRQLEIALLLADESVFAQFPELENGQGYEICEGWIVVTAKPENDELAAGRDLMRRSLGFFVVTAHSTAGGHESKG